MLKSSYNLENGDDQMITVAKISFDDTKMSLKYDKFLIFKKILIEPLHSEITWTTLSKNTTFVFLILSQLSQISKNLTINTKGNALH